MVTSGPRCANVPEESATDVDANWQHTPRPPVGVVPSEILHITLETGLMVSRPANRLDPISPLHAKLHCCNDGLCNRQKPI